MQIYLWYFPKYVSFKMAADENSKNKIMTKHRNLTRWIVAIFLTIDGLTNEKKLMNENVLLVFL